MDQPSFQTQPDEAWAFSVMQLLSGKPITLSLDAVQKKQAESLYQAFRNGQKAKALALSEKLYGLICSPEQLNQAYWLAAAQERSPSADYEMVMDSLKDVAGPAPSALAGMSLQEALEILLLAMTHSDKNAIFYVRIDPHTGKSRPTTFPLTEQLIQHFLAPFALPDETQRALLQRTLVCVKGVVMGNPAGIVAHRYRLRRQAYETAKTAHDAKKRPSPIPPAAAPKPPHTPPVVSKPRQEAQSLSLEFEKVLAFVKEPAAQAAVLQSFQTQELKQLLQASQSTGTDFGKRLENLYAQRLGPVQASQLSARLSSKMKRLLGRMGTWKEAYWQEYQDLMQSLGVWEGEAWLEKWRSHKTGKHTIAKIATAYAPPEKSTDPVAEMLQQAEKQADKRRGRNMLSAPDAEFWLNRPASQAPPEQQKVLQALSHSERLDEFLELAVAEQVWENAAENVRLIFYQLFAYFSDTDLDTIKAQLFKRLSTQDHERAVEMMAVIERTIHQLAALLKKDRRLTYPEAFLQLKAQKSALAQREQTQSSDYLRSPANQYRKYTP